MPTTELIQIDKVNVRSFSLNFLTVDWRIKPTNRPISDFSFTVLRSQSQEDTDFRVIQEDITGFTFHDPNSSQKARWRQWYYKVRAVEVSSKTFTESPTASNQEKPDRIGLSIIRRNELALRRFVGVKCFILQERTFGQRCNNCWDNIKQRRKLSNCTICFDTGFLGGFFEPIPALVNLSPSAKQVQKMNFGELTPNQTPAWMSNFPELKPRDILIEEHDGKRWRVSNMVPTRKRRAIIHQNLLLTEINRADVEWKINVDGLDRLPPFDTQGQFLTQRHTLAGDFP